MFLINKGFIHDENSAIIKEKLVLYSLQTIKKIYPLVSENEKSDHINIKDTWEFLRKNNVSGEDPEFLFFWENLEQSLNEKQLYLLLLVMSFEYLSAKLRQETTMKMSISIHTLVYECLEISNYSKLN